MKVTIGDLKLSDNTNECDKDTFFLKSQQNEQFVKNLKEYKGILTPFELLKKANLNKIKIIGITGTNGKTTTAAAIYSMLLDLGKKVALQGTRGFFINSEKIEGKSLTTPPILKNIYHLYQASCAKCDYFVMEVSSHAIAQGRIEGLEFELKIFTNLSQDHLDFHKTFENYVKVKSSFFSDDGLKLINKDDKHISYNVKGARTYGIENIATFKVSAYSLKDGIDAVIVKGDKSFEFHSSLRGFFNLYNLTCAISAVNLLENVEDFEEIVENFAGVSGRTELVHENPNVIVDFAHTPDGMEKVLESMKNDDLVVLFGAGGDRDKSKRPIMGEIACKYAKHIFVTSDNPRTEDPNKIIEDIKQGLRENRDIKIEADRKKAIVLALKSLKPYQTLMILGRGDESHQETNGKMYPFDDREVVKEFYKNFTA